MGIRPTLQEFSPFTSRIHLMVYVPSMLYLLLIAASGKGGKRGTIGVQEVQVGLTH